MAVIAVLAVLIGWRVNKARAQKRAIAVILAAGGEVIYDYEFDGTSSPAIVKTSRYPDWLRRFLGDDYLHEVSAVILSPELLLDARRIKSSELAPIRELTDLRMLHLGPCTIDHPTAVWINGLTELESLGLWFEEAPAEIRAISFHRLTKLKWLSLWKGFEPAILDTLDAPGALETLSLHDSKASDEWLVPVARFTNLKTLFLMSTSVGDKGMLHLKPLTRLQALYLDRTRITDEGVRYLSSAVSSIRLLSVDQTSVSDAAIPAILRMPNLTRLFVRSSKMTDNGRAELAKYPFFVW